MAIETKVQKSWHPRIPAQFWDWKSWSCWSPTCVYFQIHFSLRLCGWSRPPIRYGNAMSKKGEQLHIVASLICWPTKKWGLANLTWSRSGNLTILVHVILSGWYAGEPGLKAGWETLVHSCMQRTRLQLHSCSNRQVSCAQIAVPLKSPRRKVTGPLARCDLNNELWLLVLVVVAPLIWCAMPLKQCQIELCPCLHDSLLTGKSNRESQVCAILLPGQGSKQCNMIKVLEV